MEDDQQFCLRWNNHQSTLVAVFDTLLEKGTLVDCTLAAEGKFLNAHKVVLSACSPYFEALLSRHYDKHPILILKDVKFQELRAMMDYMYRGEVNISQDQLGALLKAAESLQIKGLSDNKKEDTRKAAPAPAAAPPPRSPQPQQTLPKVQGLTIEQRHRDDSRDGSISPGPRKKKRMRRKSEELDNHHDASNSSESHSLPPQNIPSSLPGSSEVPETVETKQEILLRHKEESSAVHQQALSGGNSTGASQVPIIKEKIETHTELMLEPKAEYVEEMNEDSIEDLTLDDDDLSNMDQMDDSGAGPSHGGEGSSQQDTLDEMEFGCAPLDDVETSLDDVEASRSSSLYMLPKKSQERYQVCYKQFMAWRETNVEASSCFSENELITYLEGLSHKIKPSSLWVQYSMLRSTLNLYHDVNISQYLRLKAMIKRKAHGYVPKKSKTLTTEQIHRFIREAPDKEFLLTKVALIVGIAGACRRLELVNLQTTDIEDLGKAALIQIPDAKTRQLRSFTITGEYYGVFKKYASLRPQEVNCERFFLNYQHEKCTRQPVGMNKFGAIPKAIAKYLNLKNPELYTGHCFRRTSASILVDTSGRHHLA